MGKKIEAMIGLWGSGLRLTGAEREVGAGVAPA